jgi:hypothetical protein
VQIPLIKGIATQGIAAMQSINVVVLNPLFGTAFFGTAAACVLLAVSSLFRWHKPGAIYLLVGMLYRVGTILVTIVFNVPRNEAMAGVDLASAWRQPRGWLPQQLDGLEPRAEVVCRTFCTLPLPILASPLRYALVTALSGPRTLVSPALESRANVSGEASPEP